MGLAEARFRWLILLGRREGLAEARLIRRKAEIRLFLGLTETRLLWGLRLGLQGELTKMRLPRRRWDKLT